MRTYRQFLTVQGQNLIDVVGLTKYKELYDAYVKEELAKKAEGTHTHNATDIIEDDTHKFFTLLERTKLQGIEERANHYVHPEHHTPDVITETELKKFVSQEQINTWTNNTYRKNEVYNKSEVDGKIKSVTSGLTWRGSFQTKAELEKVENPQDGWFAIVVNEPTTKGKNMLYLYEAAEPAGWKELGEILAPGIATEEMAGLMSPEMVKAHNKHTSDIAGLQSTVEGFKVGTGLPVAAKGKVGLVKIGDNINVGADGTISTHAPYSHPANHPATMITETAEKKFVSQTQINTWTNDTYRKSEVYAKGEVYTKGETDSAITKGIEEAVVIATPEEIQALFGKK